MLGVGSGPLASPTRGQFLGQVGAGLGVAGVAAALASVLASRGIAYGATAIVLVAGTAWLVSTQRTHLALALFMVYLGGLDGYLKLSTGSGQVTLVRDVLLYGLVVGVLIRAQADGKRLTLPPLSAWVIGFSLVVFVQVANPNGGSLVHSLAGVRQHLEFVPLFFLAYVFVRTKRTLRVFVVLLLVIAAANGIVNFVQFNLSPDELSAWGPGYAERIRGQEGFAGAGRTFADQAGNTRVRPFGLGSDAGSGGIVGALALGGAIALVSTVGRMRHRLLAAALAAGAVTAIVTSQGRGVIIFAVLSVIAFALLSATSQRRTANLVGVIGAVTISAFAISFFVESQGGAGAFRYESLSASKILDTARADRPTPQAVQDAITGFPLGAGLASLGPASGFAGGTELGGTLNGESAYTFLIYETGVLGALLIIGFTLSVLFIGMRRCRLEPDPESRVLLAAIVAPMAGMFVLFYGGAVTPSPPTAPYLWFAGGIVSYWLVTRQRELQRSR